ncbi:MAG: hypothetical protein DBX55_08615 [Verrucomicrobia bacterium]|nr:MAG: hypothetical protein DBX55_08615 [Verrucomicrobiota bacterium]
MFSLFVKLCGGALFFVFVADCLKAGAVRVSCRAILFIDIAVAPFFSHCGFPEREGCACREVSTGATAEFCPKICPINAAMRGYAKLIADAGLSAWTGLHTYRVGSENFFFCVRGCLYSGARVARNFFKTPRGRLCCAAAERLSRSASAFAFAGANAECVRFPCGASIKKIAPVKIAQLLCCDFITCTAFSAFACEMPDASSEL